MENLKRWAQELDNPEYKLGYDVAVQREREVVAAIDSGQWPEDAYVEYQKLVASTGNVDSARLLVRYGLESILDNTLSQSTPAGKFHDSVKFCKGEQFLELFDAGVKLDIPAVDGSTTPLMTAVYSGCLPIAAMLLSEGGAGANGVETRGQHGMTALMVAASMGSSEAIEMLLNEGAADINARHSFAGSTALHFAAEMNHEEAVRKLCEFGADARIANYIGITPLHIAAHSGANASIHALVEHCHVDVDIVISLGELQMQLSKDLFQDSFHNNYATPLFLAAQSGHSDVIATLIDMGANIHVKLPIKQVLVEDASSVDTMTHKDPLRLLGNQATEGESAGDEEENPYDTEDTSSQRAELFRRLRNENNAEASLPMQAAGSAGGAGGTQVSAQQRLVFTGYYSQPIHIAAEHGFADAIETLLENGADVNSMTMGMSPVHLAASNNRPEALKVLLEHNAKVNLISEVDGSTALFVACGNGYDVIVRLLLKYGADTSIRNTKTGAFPLLHATVNNRMQIVRMLLHDGHANADDSTPDGWRAIHIAAMHGYLATLNTLAVHNADMFAVGSDGMTAFHFAAMHSHENILIELLHLLKSAGDKLYLRGVLDIARVSDGCTPLHIAARKGDYMFVRRLLKAGARVDAKMRVDVAYAATPIYLAAQSGNAFVIKLLIMAGADPNAELEEVGSTPLLTAVERNDVEVAETLLKGAVPEANFAGADSERIVLDPEGAEEGGGGRAAVRADPNKGVASHETSKSPLMLALLRGHMGLVSLLLDHGADCSVAMQVEDGRGGWQQLNLFEIARIKEYMQAIEIMRAHEGCSKVVSHDALAISVDGEASSGTAAQTDAPGNDAAGIAL